MNTKHPVKPKKKEPAEWPSLLLGWIFILALLFGITVMILRTPKERKLVCDSSLRRTPSLTQFGTCHKE